MLKNRSTHRILAVFMTVALLLATTNWPSGMRMTVYASTPVDAAGNDKVVSLDTGTVATHSWSEFRTLAIDSGNGLSGTTVTLHEDIILDWGEEYSIPLFSGGFNGNNHTIYLRRASRASYFQQNQPFDTDKLLAMGIFGEIRGGTVQNVRIAPYNTGSSTLGATIVIQPPTEDISFLQQQQVAGQYAGGFLAGILSDGGTVRQVEVTGLTMDFSISVLRRGSKLHYPVSRYDMGAAGAIVGAMYGGGNSIAECHSEAAVKISKSWAAGNGAGQFLLPDAYLYTSAGGIVGAVWDIDNEPTGNTVVACFHKGNVSATGGYTCANETMDYTLRVNLFNNAGGVLGGVYTREIHSPSNAVAISHCVVSGNITAQSSGQLSLAPGSDYKTEPYLETTSGGIAGRVHPDYTETQTSNNIMYSMDNSYMQNLSTLGAQNIKKNVRLSGYFITIKNQDTASASTSTLRATLMNSFSSITTESLNNHLAWENYEYSGGVKLKWRTWDTQNGPTIEVVNGTNIGDKQVTFHNPDGSEVTAADRVEYTIGYFSLGQPASPPGADIELLTPAKVELALGTPTGATPDEIDATLHVTGDTPAEIATDSVGWRIFAHHSGVVFSELPLGYSGQTTAQTQPASSGSGVTHKVRVSGHDLTDLGDELVAELPGNWFPDGTPREIPIALDGQDSTELLGGIPQFRVFLTEPPEGVKYYWRSDYTPTDPDDPEDVPDTTDLADHWSLYEHNNGISLTAPDGQDMYLYAVAQRDDTSGSTAEKQPSNVVGFTISTDNRGTNIPPDLGEKNPEADGEPREITASDPNFYGSWNGFSAGGFSLKDILAGANRYLEGGIDYPSGIDSDSATGHDVDISKPITIKARYLDTGYSTEVVTYFGAKLERPGIFPNASSSVIADNDYITITYPNSKDQHVLFYKLSYEASAAQSSSLYDFATVLDQNIDLLANSYDLPALALVGADSLNSGVLPYGSETTIPFPADHEYMTVWAIAAPYPPGEVDMQYSDVAKMSYSRSNRPGQDVPQLMAGTWDSGSAVQSTSYYTQDSSFYLDHSLISEGTVYYRINGSGSFQAYDPSATVLDLYTVKNSSDITTVETYFSRPNFNDSTTQTYTVRFSHAMSSPTFSVTNPYGEAVAPSGLRSLHKAGNVLTFSIPTASIQENLRPDSGNELSGVSITEYDNQIPVIRYTMTTDGSEPADPTAQSAVYRAATPALTGLAEDRAAQAAEEIDISGDAGQVIRVKFKLFPQERTSGLYTESKEVSIEMQIRDDLSVPAASPAPEDGSISRHSVIDLYASAGEANTAIYYTVDGSVPEVLWDNAAKTYQIMNSSTQLFNSLYPIEIDQNTPSTLYIYAIHVSRNDSLGESELRMFRYTVNSLPHASDIQSLPVTSVSSPAGMRPGEVIILSTATLDAQIYYTTNGSSPNPGSSGTYLYDDSAGIPMPNQNRFVITALVHDPTGTYYSDSQPQQFVYVLSDLPRADAPVALPETSNNNPTELSRGDRITLRSDTLGTDIYYTTDGSLPDPDNYGQAGNTTILYSSSISMAPASGETQFVINAVARDRSGSSYDDSTVSQHTYELALAKPPVAYPTTSDSDIATLTPGQTITLSSPTTGVNIYYTTNGSVPVPGSSGTAQYSSGITMPTSTASFFTITAIAVHPTGTVADSEVVRFTYQPPAEVQAVSASPGEGEVVKGTQVTLSTTTEGATIYYEIDYKNKTPDDAVPFESQPYGAPIEIDQKTTISAVAYKDGVSSAVTTYEYTVASQVRTPEPDIPAGSVVPRGTKLTLTTSSGASVTYTKDGSDPSDTTNKNRMHGSEIALDAEEGKSVSLSAYATKTGMTPSDTASLSYTIANEGEIISANPQAESTVTPGDIITLTTTITDGVIYYTTDGTEPVIPSATSTSGTATTANTTTAVSGSTIRGNTVTVDGQYGDSFIIRAAVVFHGHTSTPQTFIYKLVGQTSAPSASIPDGAIIMTGAQVALSAPEGIIYYTTDGSDPTTSSQMYTEPFELPGSTVLKAIAVADGKAPSAISQYIYTMAGQVAAPSASELSGALDTGTQITLSTTTEGAAIYYSTNGTDPTEGNLKDLFVYDSPITISRPVTIKMFAVKNGLHSSVINTVTYTVQNPQPDTEDEDEDGGSQYQTSADKLFLFDQFVDAGDGPQFEGIVLRDPVTQVVVSAQAGALPEGVQLVTEQDRNPSTEHKENVMRTLDLRLESVYDISLVYDSQNVQPQRAEAVEVGIPIPKGYEDTIVIVCHISDNGTVTGFPTRRSGGVAYAVVDHFSKFAIAVPDYAVPTASGIPWIGILLGAAGAGAAAAAFLLIRRRRQKKLR